MFGGLCCCFSFEFLSSEEATLIEEAFKFVGEGNVAKWECTLSDILPLRTLDDSEFTRLAKGL